jgi:hypothetical protein
MSPEFPFARSEALITGELDGELLVYASESNVARALGADAAAIWRACDGRTDTHTLAAGCHSSHDNVRMTVARLGEPGLLDAAQDGQDGDTRGITTGPHGALWFVEDGGNKVSRITPPATIRGTGL